MTVTINGTTGVSLCDTNSVPTAALQASAVTQPKVGSGVAGNGPAFSAYLTTANQSISASTWTKVTLNAEEFDTNNCFDSTTNYRFTPNVAGYYQISANLASDAANYGGVVQLSIYKNGTAFKTSGTNYTGGSGGNTVINQASVPISALIYMNGSTDYIELYGYADFSSVPRFDFGSAKTFMSGALVRAA